MKTKLSIIALTLCINGAVIASEGHHHHFSGNPVSTMAEIVIGLKHFPTKDERGQLKDIIAHTDDENVKIVATALVNMKHAAKEEDKALLQKVMDNKSASSDIRLLAKVVQEINHKPNRSDKEALSQLTSH